MGMFGDLDNLSKKQQEVSARNQTDASENALLESEASSPLASIASSAVIPKTTKPTAQKLKKQSILKSKELDKAVVHEPVSGTTSLNNTIVRTNDRTKIRHSFDIFQDQLFELRDLAYERQRGSVKKLPLGDLVQEAIDLYLAAQHSKSK